MTENQMKEAPKALCKQSEIQDNQHGEKNSAYHSPSKARPLSEVGSLALTPTPFYRNSDKSSWRHESNIEHSPITSKRAAFGQHGLSLMMPPREIKTPNDIMPASPKPEKYTASMLPRRSRGMDFSRAATNLHHSTLAEQSSPDSSPTTSSRNMSIPNKINGISQSNGEFLGNSGYFWSSGGNSDQFNLSSSLGSTNIIAGSDSSDNYSDEDDLMDDIDDSILMTPQAKASGDLNQDVLGDIWGGQSFATRSPINFQRSSFRKWKKRNSFIRGSWNMTLSPSSRSLSRICTHEGVQGWDRKVDINHSRRESISWAANQLHITESENDNGPSTHTYENSDGSPITPSRDGQRGVIRRPVTRRGNLLPKTKGFARIQAALAEESAPVETEVRREAEVVRQARESDVDLEPRQPFITLPSSPILSPGMQSSVTDVKDDEKLLENTPAPCCLQQSIMRNSKGKGLWETLKDEKNTAICSPPMLSIIPRASINNAGAEISLDSPLSSSMSYLPAESTGHQSCSTSRSGTPQPITGPTAAEITQKLSKKRLRDDDFHGTSLKRRAVSPGLSAHNSPIAQSPLQRDIVAWGSRPSSTCNVTETLKSPASTIQKRVGLQGMMDTNDGLMKMSIE